MFKISTHLSVGVGNPELHALHVAIDHVVDGIGATTANAQNLRGAKTFIIASKSAVTSTTKDIALALMMAWSLLA